MINQGGGRNTLSGRVGGGGPGGRPPGGVVGVLHVVAGNDRGKQHPLVSSTTQIGRGADQDFVLADIAVSRRHVQILIEGNRYRVTDLGSGNGTLVNGVRTASALLNDGDQIEIGNTVLRFEHPPSSAAAQGIAPVPQAAPQQRTMIADAPAYPPSPAPYNPGPVPYTPPAPSYGAPTGYGAAGPYAARPDMPAEMGPMPPARPSSPMVPITDAQRHVRRRGGLLDTTGKKVAVFGTIAVVLIVGGLFVARPFLGGGSAAEAARLFAEGKVAYTAGDFDKAKGLFQGALKADPSSQQAAKYLQQCEVELRSKEALAQSAKFRDGKRWDDALKKLDAVDKTTAAWDEAEKLRKGIVPEAIKVLLADAREAIEGNDQEAAKKKVEDALVLDPDNSEAQELEQKLRGSAPEAPAPAAAAPRPARTERPSPAVAARPVAAPAKQPTAPARAGGDDEEPSVASPGDVLASKAAGPYRARDFDGAAQALRVQAKSQKASAQQKTITLAQQVQKLGETYQKAEADKARNPVAAVQGYQQAITLDAAVGRGTHGEYFRGQAGKLAKDAARLAFAQQRFDTAFEMAKAALKYGGDDGGVTAQLKTKAASLNTNAAGLAKTNPNGAKAMWRMVLRMVQPGDPAYVTAQKGLASVVAGRDEDED